MKLLYLILIIMAIETDCQFNQMITYVKYVEATSTTTDYHFINILWTDILLSNARDPGDTTKFNPWRYSSMKDGINTPKETTFGNDLSLSLYKHYVPEYSGKHLFKFSVWYTVSTDSPITKNCGANKTVDITFRVKYFNCSKSARTFYDSLITGDVNIVKALVPNEGSLDDIIFNLGYNLASLSIDTSNTTNTIDKFITGNAAFLSSC